MLHYEYCFTTEYVGRPFLMGHFFEVKELFLLSS